MAQTSAMPSAAWAGVERIVITCDVDRIAVPALRADICRKALEEARRQTRYPVSIGEAGSEQRPFSGAGRHDLTLHVVAGSLSGEGAGRLTIGLRLVRHTLPRDVDMAPPASFTISAAPRLLGPALRRAIGAILAPPPPARLRRPFPTPPRAY